jgi:rhodanese-related sulfurtransferase
MRLSWWPIGLAGVLVVAGLYAFVSPYRISSEEANRRLRAGEIDVVLDVRTDLERNTLGFYPSSVHIPAASLASEFPERYPNRKTRTLIYCNTGQRARRAADVLQGLGYTNAVYITGSYTGLISTPSQRPRA